MWMFFDPSCQQYCMDTTFSDMSHVAQSHLDLGQFLRPGGGLQLSVTFLSRFCGNASSQVLSLSTTGQYFEYFQFLLLYMSSPLLFKTALHYRVTSCYDLNTLSKL